MTHARHLAQLAAKERQELLREEAQAKARQEAQDVHQGVTETLVLGDRRGEEFHAPSPDRDGKPKPVRRLSGLEFMAGKGLLTEAQITAGERYGEAYRAAVGEESLKSCLDVGPGGGGGEVRPAFLLSRAEWRAGMRAKLALWRASIKHPRLIAALDAICGEELTPRGLARDGRDAAVISEQVRIALDILAEEFPAN